LRTRKVGTGRKDALSKRVWQKADSRISREEGEKKNGDIAGRGVVQTGGGKKQILEGKANLPARLIRKRKVSNGQRKQEGNSRNDESLLNWK